MASEAEGSPQGLALNEIVGRAEALFGHDRGRAEDHRQPDDHQDERGTVQPFVDANSFRHKTCSA